MKILILFLLSLPTYSMEISYSIIDLNQEKVVESKNENQSMVLASVSKLYSFYYVLNHAKLNEHFETRILTSRDSKIVDGVLQGDLIIDASGDPFITAQNFINLIFQIKSQGIKRIKGDLFVLEKDFWKTDRLSNLGLEDQADNSSMGPLNFEFNRFRFDKFSNKAIPPMDYLKFKNKKMKKPGLKFFLKEKSNDFEHWIKNENEKHKSFEEIPTRDSSLFSAHFFRYLAEMNNLKLPKPKITNELKGSQIAIHKSLPMERLIELGIEYSNNLIAEMLLYKVTKKDPQRSAAEMLQWYKNKFQKPKFKWEKTNLVNASGLTIKNLTTANNLTSLLAHIYSDQSLERSFISFLSINGHSGGIRKRLRSSDNSFRVYAKTGSLFYVNNLAGYFVGKSGKKYAFSIFTTDSKKREKLNQKNSNELQQLRDSSKKWHYISTQKIDSLLKKLINKY